MENKNKIIILAPHTDDGELGCGATIAKFLEEDKDVYYVAFSICEESVPDGFPKDALKYECQDATKFLGIHPDNLIILNYPVRKFTENRQPILEDLVQLKKDLSPDLVILPSSFDVHQDHATIYQEGIRAFKESSILGYEFMWNNYTFSSTMFSVVEERHVRKKIEALDIYKTQEKRFYMKEKLITGQANFRGLQIYREYAEAFEVIRWILE
ncbi:MAG: PIG-L family deacetylase [Candidatus Marinimicrobia bacterium]|nr:PIG-L family deacetylase [Candidatus Neomarinimicrobiota bacterium]MCF7828553.1 PIG-L family deacetylase [Candidatus Neomarinimicrobiota bacterium]MCF7880294.1 PIG-L family deacetylase [Candidatus Neomarinimicrobiota bacterium]